MHVTKTWLGSSEPRLEWIVQESTQTEPLKKSAKGIRSKRMFYFTERDRERGGVQS